MVSTNDNRLVMVTGADGHIGREVCRLFGSRGAKLLPVDAEDSGMTGGIVQCDLRNRHEVAGLFQSPPVRDVIHLAAILPTAFKAHPFEGVDVNLTGCFELLRHAVHAHVRRFVFASSRSVYGWAHRSRPFAEDDPAAPDDPYGASKQVVERVGENLAAAHAIEFISLRIAVVIGLGIKKTSSPWRSQIFEPASGRRSIKIPFAPGAVLPLVHVEDVAKMLVNLVEAPEVRSTLYNTPAENWEARQLKEVVETFGGAQVELLQDGPQGGPLVNGSRFAREFGFEIRGIRERLSSSQVRR
jgi:nucleoside-diphosphate-sugar epimerase